MKRGISGVVRNGNRPVGSKLTLTNDLLAIANDAPIALAGSTTRIVRSFMDLISQFYRRQKTSLEASVPEMSAPVARHSGVREVPSRS